MSKGTAFIIGIGCLMLIFIMMWVSKEPTQYGAIILGVVSLTGGYIGLQVVNNAQTGKNFSREFWDCTHEDRKEDQGGGSK